MFKHFDNILFYSTSHPELLFPSFAPQIAQLEFVIVLPYAPTRNQTHMGSVAPPRGTLIQGALPTELPQLQLDNIFDESHILYQKVLSAMRWEI